MIYYEGMPLHEVLFDQLNDTQRETVEAFMYGLIHKDMRELESYKDGGLGWSPKIGKQFDLATNYRIKPKPEFVPFTLDDAEMFLGKIIKPKNGKDKFRGMICGAGTGSVSVSTQGSRTYDELLSSMLFLDDSPCGKINK